MRMFYKLALCECFGEYTEESSLFSDLYTHSPIFTGMCFSEDFDQLLNVPFGGFATSNY